MPGQRWAGEGYAAVTGNVLPGWEEGVRALPPKPFIPQLFSLKAFLLWDLELLS